MGKPDVKAKLTIRQKKAILKDEREGVAMYKRLGFRKQAADERRHLKFFEKQPVKRKG